MELVVDGSDAGREGDVLISLRSEERTTRSYDSLLHLRAGWRPRLSPCSPPQLDLDDAGLRSSLQLWAHTSTVDKDVVSILASRRPNAALHEE